MPAFAAGTRLRCYCGDCQTAARLNDPDQDTLAPVGASDIWQSTPDRMTFLQGVENLKIYKLSPRGGYRWYAMCCGTLMFSTLRNLNVPFVSIPLRQPEVEEADTVLGQVRCHAFAESARPGMGAPEKSSGMVKILAAALSRAVLARMTGRGRKSPLRQSDGAPIAPVEVITLETRKAARPDHLK
ncbi:DUF6151 family protein [Roseovarius phycicola]|uniref:DUF6151 family protein n=1 Tax=Roseovarius phycicola TaxID=3080976 RepID=A0ABZ2HFL5_9RHOB